MTDKSAENDHAVDGRMTRGGAPMVRDKRSGRVVARGAGLSKMQEEFARNFVRNGGNASAAARAAGYSPNGISTTSWELVRHPLIANRIRELQRRQVQTDGVRIAWGTLEEVMQDREQPGATRVRAAEVTLKWAKEIGDTSKPGAVDGVDGAKSMAEMTLEELTALVSRLEAAASMPDAIDITPQSAKPPLCSEHSEGAGEAADGGAALDMDTDGGPGEPEPWDE
jgi:phage terminase small subunit